MIKTRKMMAIMMLHKLYMFNKYGDFDDAIQKLEEGLRNGLYDKDDK